MTDIRKQQFHTIETDLEEMEQKIRNHRKRVALGIAAAAAVVATFVIAMGIYISLQEYKNYEVGSEWERNDSEATKYESFYGNILRYNKDGVFYVDAEDALIWNQAFEMQNPISDICESYVAIADLGGNQIYVMDVNGVQGEIMTNRPIEAVCVANQGTIGVLTQEDGTGRLELYNKDGSSIAFGEIHAKNSGYPVDIALSNDANKLAVSILGVRKGKVETTIAFYNFSSVGQNQIDNIVGTYSYENVVIPELNFISNDNMIAFGDDRILFFEGKQKPEEKKVLELSEEVKSIFFDKDYFGLVYDGEEKSGGYKMHVYDAGGKLRLEQEFQMSYEEIEFLDNHEICIRNDYECQIYTMRGVKKFAYAFDRAVHKIFSNGRGRKYTFILDGVIEKVKLT